MHLPADFYPEIINHTLSAPSSLTLPRGLYGKLFRPWETNSFILAIRGAGQLSHPAITITWFICSHATCPTLHSLPCRQQFLHRFCRVLCSCLCLCPLGSVCPHSQHLCSRPQPIHVHLLWCLWGKPMAWLEPKTLGVFCYSCCCCCCYCCLRVFHRLSTHAMIVLKIKTATKAD